MEEIHKEGLELGDKTILIEESSKQNVSQELALKDARKDEIDNLFKAQYDTNKSISENAREVAKTFATGKKLQDDVFVDEIGVIVGETIKEEVIAEKKNSKTKKQAETIQVINEKANQFYSSYKPIFEFANILEACGLIFMKFMLFLMILPYSATKFVRGLFKVVEEFFIGLNDMFLAITKFEKPLQNLLKAIAWFVLIISLILVLIFGVEYLFKIQILP